MTTGNKGTITNRVKISPMIVNFLFIEYATNNKACPFIVHMSEPSDC